jgi:hypothetical protein
MNDHVGSRFVQWTTYDEPDLTPAQKARAYDQFVAEFEALPAHLEPYDGWAVTMARFCRSAAGRLRGEPAQGAGPDR